MSLRPRALTGRGASAALRPGGQCSELGVVQRFLVQQRLRTWVQDGTVVARPHASNSSFQAARPPSGTANLLGSSLRLTRAGPSSRLCSS